jgi:ATP-dependent DNA helicase RecQ
VRKPPEGFDPSTRSGRPRKRTREAMEAVGPENHGLYEALRLWRRETAAEQGVPPYVIFHDRTLAEIALFRPATLSDLAMIGGVGQTKLDHYGQAVLQVVRKN